MQKAKTVTKKLTKAEAEPQKNVGNQIHEIQVKHLFLSQAITALWGNSDSICGKDVVFGCHLLMHDVSKDLKELERSLDHG